MWTVLKFDKKKIKDLKKIFQKKLGSSPVFYIPKIKIQRFFKNQAKDYEFDVLGNYAFCYHEKIADAIDEYITTKPIIFKKKNT